MGDISWLAADFEADVADGLLVGQLTINNWVVGGRTSKMPVLRLVGRGN